MNIELSKESIGWLTRISEEERTLGIIESNMHPIIRDVYTAFKKEVKK